jgi:DNA repair exonuclease SbcCD ATPase subunit
MNDIEKAIETQQKLITNWEQRIQELEEVIKKYPWGRDGLEYDFGDWRETELKRRKEQIEIALITIDALKKQTPKKVKDIKANLIAISALEKQTPKEIIYDYGWNETRCPRCNTIFGYAYEEDETEDIYYAPYCYECGQCLDWEVENE